MLKALKRLSSRASPDKFSICSFRNSDNSSLSTASLGKDAGSDIKNKKLTYVSVYGLESAIKTAEELIDQSKSKIIGLDSSFNKNRLIEICDFIISRDK